MATKKPNPKPKAKAKPKPKSNPKPKAKVKLKAKPNPKPKPKSKSNPKPKAKVKHKQARPKPKAGAKPQRKKRNSSLLDYPISAMSQLGKAAASDFAKLSGPVIQSRRVATGKGKGTRRNPFRHKIAFRGAK